MIYVLYHASCRDGFAASYAAWKKFGYSKNVKYIAVQYGKPIPEMEDNSEVYILDFSYPREQLINLNKRMKFLLVLDHHKTAKEDLEGLHFAEFDMNKSGAVLSWEYFHPTEEMPYIFRCIEDRDLWNWKLKDLSDPVTEAIATYPYDYKVWDEFQFDQLFNIGTGIVRWRDNYVSRIIQKPMWDWIGEYKVPVVNTGVFISHVGNALCKKYPKSEFSACYFDTELTTVWSLRSIGDFDVSEVAKSFGGGGHKNASGYSMPHSIIFP